jgi:tetratricopeptide (TPR) repeat protein
MTKEDESKGMVSTHDLAGLICRRMTETLQGTSGKLSERSAAGALARGIVFHMASYFEEAIESYKEALALDPALDEAAARLVLAQLKARQYDKALASAMRLSARAPGFELKEMSSNEHTSALTLLGDALAYNGRIDDAIQAYQAARRTSSGDTFAAGRLAQLYLASGEPKKALEQTKAFAGNPRFRDLSTVLKLGHLSEALLPAFNRASMPDLLMRADPGRPMVVDGAARVAVIAWGDDRWCGELPDGDTVDKDPAR